ncbi:MAG: acyltransferase family protein [Candidatus Sigynarchaeum springense]
MPANSTTSRSDQGAVQASPAQEIANKHPVGLSTRLASIDAIRGFDMFWITGGTDLVISFCALVFPATVPFFRVQFSHPAWSGFTFYDLIFPLFVFISGLSITFSITRRVERGEDKKKMYKHVAVRTLILFLLGLAYNCADFDPFALRVAGVLQRIAIASCIAAIIAMNAKPRTQLYIVIGILLGYWAIMALVPVPCYGAGNYTQYGNLAGYVDRLLLPYPEKWCCYEYGDSEGILSTLPAVASAMLGTLAGHELRSERKPAGKISMLLFGGTSSFTIALAWHFVFPINKYMWTSSFVLFAGGWSMLLLAVFYWIIDVKGIVKWSFFFRVIGSNAILIYLLGGLVGFGFLEDLVGASSGLDFLVACLDVGVRWLFLYILYRKRWFVKF